MKPDEARRVIARFTLLVAGFVSGFVLGFVSIKAGVILIGATCLLALFLTMIDPDE